MTDEQLGRELCPDDPELGARVAAEMALDRRAVCERMIEVADEANLRQAGLGPKPKGVILCGPKQIKRAGRF